jgi:predicted lipid-binding transport protein (Tim44 family)
MTNNQDVLAVKRICAPSARPKRLLIALFSLLLGLGLVHNDAEARRLGGGGSSGLSRGGNIMNRQALPPRPAPTQGAAAATAPQGQAAAPARSPWMGMLGGLALGAGLGALLGHFGLGGGMGGILMILLVAVVIMFVVRLLRSRAPGAQPLQYASAAPISSGPPAFETMAQTQVTEASTGTVPAGFDSDGFVRQAKLNFVRLQAANDAGNMDDIRAFTTPEMFAEIQLEYQERNRAAQQTDILQLDAQLLDVTNEANRQIASVRFHGSIREVAGAEPAAFDEVWHLARATDGSSGWVIAGIQQYA